MRLAIISDFHGKISKGLIKKLKKSSPDMILSSGDFCGNEELGKLLFKYFYGKTEEERESLPKAIKDKSTDLERKSFKAGFNVLKSLDKLNIPILAIHGNWDPTSYPYDLGGEKQETKEFSFKKLRLSNIKFVDFYLVELENFVLVGGASSTTPGVINLKKFRNKIRECKTIKEKLDLMIFFLKVKREYLRRKKIFSKLFFVAKKLSKEKDKPFIFLTHNCPYKTKLDVIKTKLKNIKNGEHYGSFLERKLIEKFQPTLVLCGHMHENTGKDKIKNSLIVNVGSAKENKFFLLDIEDNHIKAIKFMHV